ncbi:MAG: S8 family serine peptidase [Armatimonadota bacterium]
MNTHYRLLFAVAAFLTLFCQSKARGIIVRFKDPTDIAALVRDYPFILDCEQAGKSPFVRLEVEGESGQLYSQFLESDERIVWAEDEALTSFRGNYSSHGSSVAAIFDRETSAAINKGIFKQINFVPLATLSSNLKVGIVDTGVSFSQPSILDNVVAGMSFVPSSRSINDSPRNLDTNLNGAFDEGAGHGTMVAGVILQIAPNTPLVIAKSADSDGVGDSWSVLQGVVFCVENDTKIINLSLGSRNQLAGFPGLLDWVEQSGSVIVSPIGNNASNMTLYPAGYSNVICVTGLMSDNTKAPFSNWNSVARVAAPASGVLSAWYDGGSAVWSGTSLSAPIVSGCLAAALSSCPRRSPHEIRNALNVSGRDIDSQNPDYSGQLGKLIDFVALLRVLKE